MEIAGERGEPSGSTHKDSAGVNLSRKCLGARPREGGKNAAAKFRGGARVEVAVKDSMMERTDARRALKGRENYEKDK